VGQRLLRRLADSPVPVRTSVLVRDLGVHRSQVAAALARLRRMGLVATEHRVVDDERRTPDGGRGGKWREAFWSRVTRESPRTPAPPSR
jgi:hypothetical protein